MWYILLVFIFEINRFIFMAICRRVNKKLLDVIRRHAKFLGGWPKKPPPPPPNTAPAPPWDEKGTILLSFKFCIHLHTYQDMQLKWCRVMGQKLRYGRPCTRNLPGTHNWLAQSHIASISSELQNCTGYLMLTLSWKFGVNRCSFGLTTPRPAPKRVCL